MTRPTRIGIQLPEVERVVRWPEYRAMALAAEAAGFDSVWLGDHLLYRGDGVEERGQWEAWTLLAGLAAVTKRVNLGPLVSCVGFHNPGVLAKMACTVDELSGGRLIFGLGAGWNGPDFTAFGLPYDHRVARFEESFSIMQPLLNGERVTYDGIYHQADDLVMLPPPAHRIPLMIGSNGDRMLSIALPYVSAWNTWYDDYGNTVKGFGTLNERISDAARAAGRAPEEIERSVCMFLALAGGTNTRIYDKDFEPISGSMADVAAHISALADAGADEVIVVVDPITEDSIRSLGEAIDILTN